MSEIGFTKINRDSHEVRVVVSVPQYCSTIYRYYRMYVTVVDASPLHRLSPPRHFPAKTTRRGVMAYVTGRSRDHVTR